MTRRSILPTPTLPPMRCCLAFFVMVLVSLFAMQFIRVAHSIKWLGLYRMPMDHDGPIEGSHCFQARGKYGLNKRQFRFCVDAEKRFAIAAIRRAALVVAFYCPDTFSDRRWNCSSVRHAPHLTRDISSGTREQAVVHAFASAALLFEVARRCSDGKIRHCGCGSDQLFTHSTAPEPSSDFQTPQLQNSYFSSACHDNIDMGIRYAQAFLGFHRVLGHNRPAAYDFPSPRYGDQTAEYGEPDRPFHNEQTVNSRKNKQQKPLKLMKLVDAHNYGAGIEVMLKTTMHKCQCHGVSGSCTQKVCYRQLTRMDSQTLQSKLKSLYLDAKNVVRSGDRTLDMEVYKEGEFVRKPVSRSDLVYVQHSPDFCNPEPTEGSLGTRDRQCNPTGDPGHSMHCVNMCCGRGYYQHSYMVTQRCQCRLTSDNDFKVICNECPVAMTTYHCN